MWLVLVFGIVLSVLIVGLLFSAMGNIDFVSVFKQIGILMDRKLEIALVGVRWGGLL